MTSQTVSVEPERADDVEIEYVKHTEMGHGLLPRLGAEVFGTFLLVFVGIGIALYSSVTGSPGSLGITLGFGIALIAGVAAVGHISGGHFNPAVSLGAAIAGRISWTDLLPYWVAQIIGGLAATAALFLTIPSGLAAALGIANTRTFFSSTSTGFGDHSPLSTLSSGAVTFSAAPALIVEVIATALFVGIVLAVTDARLRSKVAPVAIGLAFGVLVLVATPITGGSLNPARSTATAFFSESWALGQVWLFWVAPLLGGAIAGLLVTVFAPAPALPDDADEDLEDYDDVDDDVVDDATASAVEDEDEDDEDDEDDVVSPDSATESWAVRTNEDDDETVVEEPVITDPRER